MSASSAAPVSRAFLERYRLELRKDAKTESLGGHLRRRKGQSLDFYGFRPYVAGDDYRHIDWRASARAGSLRGDRLVRTFHSEERLTLAVSVDHRDTMFFPGRPQKLTLAAWLASAIASVARLTDDRVILHRLFGRGGGVRDLGRRPHPSAATRFLDLLTVPADEVLNQRALAPLLRPTTVWILISDFYFTDATAELKRALVRAQENLCWVILVNLDVWPEERRLLLEGPRQVEGPGLDVADPLRIELDSERAERATENIEEHWRSLVTPARRGALDTTQWSWDAEAREDPERFFRDRFASDPVLRRVFRRESSS